MARIRYSRPQAEAEAAQRAKAFVAGLPFGADLRLAWCEPDPSAPSRRTSKHPLFWVAVFRSAAFDGEIVDGGETFVTVDLESDVVAVAR